MKITNHANFPQAIVDALSHDGHITKGDISVTTLIDAPQIRYLRKKHYVEMTQDVSDMVFALFGTAVHSILEKANINSVRRAAFMEVINALKEIHARGVSGQLKETENEKDSQDAGKVMKWLLSFMFKYYPELENKYIYEMTLTVEIGGYVVCGTMDIYDKEECLIEDYKVCSTFMYTNKEHQVKWREQLNCYALMLRKNGYEVKGARIHAIFRDYTRAAYKRSIGYPQKQVMTIPIQIFDNEIIEKFMLDMVEQHKAADAGNPRECTGKERWASADHFSVVKEGSTRALPLSATDNELVAKKYIDDNQYKHKVPISVLKKPGINRRCQDYCNVAEFCPQFAKIKAEQPKEEEWD